MNYDELERIAKAATPGPWGKYSDHGSYVANDKGEIAKCLPAPSLQMGWNNADHIAAFSPDRCLKLIASLRKAEARLEQSDRLLERAQRVIELANEDNSSNFPDVSADWLADYEKLKEETK